MRDGLDAWIAALLYSSSILVAWGVGWRWGKRDRTGQDDEVEGKFTDASLALLGLLLAFTFSMSIDRHDVRRHAVIDDSSAIGDFYTCASLLNEPVRSRLQSVVHQYALHKLEVARQPTLDSLNSTINQNLELQAKMTSLVAEAVNNGTPFANTLVAALNNLTSRDAAHLAAFRTRLPGIVVALLLLGAVLPAFLMGLQQGRSNRGHHFSGVACFLILVVLVIYVIFDLNKPAEGLIVMSTQPLEHQIRAMGN